MNYKNMNWFQKVLKTSQDLLNMQLNDISHEGTIQPNKVEHPDGTVEYYKDGKLHNQNGPAVIHPDNKREYWFNGKPYKSFEYLKQAVENAKKQEDRAKNKYEIAEPHLSSNGNVKYTINGKISREDGPAVQYANGREEYWLDGKKYNEDLWKQLVKYKLQGRAK